MNMSYSLNPVCPKSISNKGVFRKIEVEFLRFYCIKTDGFVYLFDLILYVPVNNFSVLSGRVFLKD